MKTYTGILSTKNCHLEGVTLLVGGSSHRIKSIKQDKFTKVAVNISVVAFLIIGIGLPLFIHNSSDIFEVDQITDILFISCFLFISGVFLFFKTHNEKEYFWVNDANLICTEVSDPIGIKIELLNLQESLPKSKIPWGPVKPTGLALLIYTISLIFIICLLTIDFLKNFTELIYLPIITMGVCQIYSLNNSLKWKK